jgi:hypothetical protein
VGVVVGEREAVPFELADRAWDALGEGEHVVPMRVRDAAGQVVATLGDVVVNVTRDDQGWVWAATIPGEVDRSVADLLGEGRFSFVVPDGPDLPARRVTAEDLAAEAEAAWQRFRDARI